MAEPADDARDRPSTAAKALAWLLDARHGAPIDRSPPTLDEMPELFRLYYRQTPEERIGFMVLARIYAQLDDAAAGKLLLRAGELAALNRRQS